MAKPRKVEESAAPYSSAQPRMPEQNAERSHDAESVARYADPAAFRKAANKVFVSHRELFRKLAQ